MMSFKPSSFTPKSISKSIIRLWLINLRFIYFWWFHLRLHYWLIQFVNGKFIRSVINFLFSINFRLLNFVLWLFRFLILYRLNILNNLLNLIQLNFYSVLNVIFFDKNLDIMTRNSFQHIIKVNLWSQTHHISIWV